MKTVSIDLGTNGYPIHISSGLLHDAKSYIDKTCSGQKIIITDENVAPLYAEKLAGELKCKIYTVLAGEQSKSFETFQSLSEKILTQGIDRKTTLIAIGGGVVGDLTGFLAASLLRGLPFIQVPTTLLSQTDSSVGGKTGINTSVGKNLIGAFHQPKLVLIDPDTLKTLPKEELLAGYAEVVKYALIRDRGFFNWLDDNAINLLLGDTTLQTEAIARSCQHKADIVSADEFEIGQRALLNLGHTFGHAIESASNYKVLHGLAVAVGTCLAYELSERLGHSKPEELKTVVNHFKKVGLPTNIKDFSLDVGFEDFIDSMRKDKKAENGTLTFIIPKGVGDAFIAKDVPENTIRELLNSHLTIT